jgi:uncharacterized OB-fold protein
MSENLDPEINELNLPFWNAVSEGQLLLPYCKATERHFWPPCPVSPFLTAGAVEWRSIDAVGTLRAVVTYHRVFQKILSELIPYRIGLVELIGGVRLQAHLPGVADRPSIGDRVKISFSPLLSGSRPVPTILKADS